MSFGLLFPAADVPIGKSFVFARIGVSDAEVGILEPDLRSDSFLQGFLIGFAAYLFDDITQKDIARVAVRMLGVRLEIRRAFGDTGDHFVLRSRLQSPGLKTRSPVTSWMPLRCASICAMVILSAFGICGKNLSSVSVSFNFPSSTS